MRLGIASRMGNSLVEKSHRQDVGSQVLALCGIRLKKEHILHRTGNIGCREPSARTHVVGERDILDELVRNSLVDNV